MAIISIPSSIAGITIPGLSSKGPLGALFDNPFNQDILQYPRDLNSATKGHVVQFSILETQPLGYESIKTSALNLLKDKGISADNLSFSAGVTAAQNALSSAGTAIVGAIADPAGTLEEFKEGISKGVGNTVDSAIGFATNTKLNFQPKRVKTKSYISLYMPDTLNFQIGAAYGEISALDAMKASAAAAVNLIPHSKNQGTKSKAVTSTIAGVANVVSPMLPLLTAAAGYAVNPQIQVVFQGIDFRTYQMAFIFTPYSRQEAQTVEKIIKAFRENALPKVQTGIAGMFFVAPSAFDVKFLFNGKENTHINKIKTSVITSIDVNYSPNGWSAHDDGTPIQTTMTIQFKELELVDSNAVKQGY